MENNITQDWLKLMALVNETLSITPYYFWKMTPRELSGFIKSKNNESISKSQLDELINLFK